MAPLQKRALYSLVIGILLACALIVVFITGGGITAFDQDPGLRVIVYILWIGVPIAYLILVNLTLKKPQQFDERDKLIMERAPRVQWKVTIFSLAAWVIALTEVYHEQGQMPLIYLTLIFISTLIVGTLALSLGIVLGYRSGQ